MKNIIKVLMSDKKQLSNLDWLFFKMNIGWAFIFVGFLLSAFIHTYFFLIVVIGLLIVFFADI